MTPEGTGGLNCVPLLRKIPSVLLYSLPVGEPSPPVGQIGVGVKVRVSPRVRVMVYFE